MSSKPTAPAAEAIGPTAPVIEPVLDAYRPVSASAKRLILLLTLGTVVGLAVLMLQPHRRLMAAKLARAEAAVLAACPPGAASAAPGCPGGRMVVTVQPLVSVGPAGPAR